jgi:hypothetical protein
VTIQFVSVFIIMHVHTGSSVYSPFSRAFILYKALFCCVWNVADNSVHSSSDDFSPKGQISWPSSCTVCHENNWALHNFSVKKKKICLLFFQQVPIHVCCITNFNTHLSWSLSVCWNSASNSKWQGPNTNDIVQIILDPDLTITFLTD